jgi:hypothetical protein
VNSYVLSVRPYAGGAAATPGMVKQGRELFGETE